MPRKKRQLYVIGLWNGPGEPWDVIGVFDPDALEKPFRPTPRKAMFKGQEVWEVDCRPWAPLMKKLERSVRRRFQSREDAEQWCSQLIAEQAIQFVAPKMKPKTRRRRRAKRERGKVNNRLRYKVLRRDNFHCMACGASGKDDVLVVDHIKPVSKGGRTTMANLQTLCQTCNTGKGAMDP